MMAVCKSVQNEQMEIVIFGEGHHNEGTHLAMMWEELAARHLDAEEVHETIAEELAACEELSIYTGMFSKRQVITFISEEWRTFCAGVGPHPALPPIPEPEEKGQRSGSVKDLPFATTNEDGVPTIVMITGTYEGPSDAPWVWATDDSTGESHLVPFAQAEQYAARQQHAFDAAELLPPGLLSIIKKMPNSVHYPEESVLEAYDIQAMAEASSLPKRFTAPVLKYEPGKGDAFDLAVQNFFGELADRLKGKVIGSVYPSEPAALIVALEARAKGGILTARPDHELLYGKPPAPRAIPAPKGVQTPLAAAMRAKAFSDEEWDGFLESSVHITTSKEDREFTNQKPSRQMGNLERFLKNRGVNMDTLHGMHAGLGCDELEQCLLEFRDLSENAPPAAEHSSGSGAAEIAAATAKALAGALNERRVDRDSGSAEERVAKSVLRDAARAVECDPRSVARLEVLQMLARKQEFTEFEKMKANETNPDVLMLINTDVVDAGKAMQGVLSDRLWQVVTDVRDGKDERLLHALFPDKTSTRAITSRQRSAIERISVGKLTGVKLLHLLDKDDAGTINEPFKSFSALSDPRAAFADCCNMMRDIVTLTRPGQVSEAMQFFRKLNSTFERYLERGASWKLLGGMYKELATIVETPSLKYSRGHSDVAVLFDLKLSYLSRLGNTYMDELEEGLADERRRASSEKAKEKEKDKDRKEKEKKEKEKLASGRIPQAAFDEAKKKMDAGVAKVGDKKPCISWFIMGACTRGDSCGFHHEGKPGKFKPPSADK